MNVVPVILAGGIGERFWPLSRSTMPKQLLSIISKRSMLEETIARVRTFCRGDVKPLIMTSGAIAGEIKRALGKKVAYDVIAEPVGKNTAPPVAAAAAFIRKKYGDAVMLVLSADHAISPTNDFIAAVRYAVKTVEGEGGLCVFGIEPVRPDTGYGYIQMGKKLGSDKGAKAFRVKRFVEKPSAAKAKAYVRAKVYYWNSGMFVWKASVILEEMAQHMPKLHKQTAKLQKSRFSKKNLDAFFHAADKESIDYGILEKSSRVSAVCGTFKWDDIGAWDAISRIHPSNAAGSTVVGPSVYCGDSSGTIVVNKSNRAVAAVGLDDMVVVATDDAVLVMPRSKLPQIKDHLGAMKKDRGLPKQLF